MMILLGTRRRRWLNSKCVLRRSRCLPKLSFSLRVTELSHFALINVVLLGVDHWTTSLGESKSQTVQDASPFADIYTSAVKRPLCSVAHDLIRSDPIRGRQLIPHPQTHHNDRDTCEWRPSAVAQWSALVVVAGVVAMYVLLHQHTWPPPPPPPLPTMYSSSCSSLLFDGSISNSIAQGVQDRIGQGRSE